MIPSRLIVGGGGGDSRGAHNNAHRGLLSELLRSAHGEPSYDTSQHHQHRLLLLNSNPVGLLNAASMAQPLSSLSFPVLFWADSASVRTRPQQQQLQSQLQQLSDRELILAAAAAAERGRRQQQQQRDLLAEAERFAALGGQNINNNNGRFLEERIASLLLLRSPPPSEASPATSVLPVWSLPDLPRPLPNPPAADSGHRPQKNQQLMGRQEKLLSKAPSHVVTSISSIVKSSKAPRIDGRVGLKLRNPKTPEEVLAALTLLGTTPRRRTDPYVDCSVWQDPGMPRCSRGGVDELFPDKLYRVLQELEESGRDDIASFLPHGRAFRVHKMNRFLNEVLPKYFTRQSKWKSFCRQCNLYGFVRISSGRDAGAYYHELFLKGRPTLCHYIRRVGGVHRNSDFPSGGGGGKNNNGDMDHSVETDQRFDEPDLYAQPPVTPLYAPN